MRKVGILGGTFNPPHLGHLIIANEVRDALQLDEVRFMPTAQSPHKEVNGASATDRFKMVELAVEPYPHFVAFPFEIERGGISYTFDTMQVLKQLEPESDFYFIVGGDMIDGLPTWYRIEELVKIVTFVGVQRPGNDGKSNIPIRYVEIPQIDISSTLLRQRFAQGQTVTFFIPEKVEAYIRQEGLYGSGTNSFSAT